MFSIFKNRFGIPGVISVIALVFAMIGGAYAATNEGGSGVASASKTTRGKQGKPGKRGPAGLAGPVGSPGAQGPVGAAGKDGAKGTDGTNGTSATTASFGGNQHGCPEGGIEVKSASATTYVCNGKEGLQGEPGPLLETLPEGKTLKGTWAATVGSLGFATTAVSFQFPVAVASFPRYVKEGKEGEEFAEDCPGSAADPEAKEGVLCFYTTVVAGELGAVSLAPTALFGGEILFSGGTAGTVAIGSWAVTGS
jgi:hypothetical protein